MKVSSSATAAKHFGVRRVFSAKGGLVKIGFIKEQILVTNFGVIALCYIATFNFPYSERETSLVV
jgi:hypothetical protein